MNPNDKERFTIAIGAMAETFRQKVTAATIQGYHLGLSDLSIEQIEQSVSKALRSSKFMPSVVELRGFAGIPTPEQQAADAWQTFCDGVRKVGYYGSIEFTDRRINRVVRHLGGWGRVCDLSGDAFQVWLRKDFLAIFADFAERGLDCSGEYPLLGFIARQNGTRWPDLTPPPVLFGPPTDKKLIEHKRARTLPKLKLKHVP